MNLITKIIEPTKILMIWQAMTSAPDTEQPCASGKRYIVGKIMRETSGNVSLRYLHGTEDFREARAHGFVEYPAFRDTPGLPVHTENVMTALERRIPSKDRSDFQDYLKYYGIDPNAHISPLALLGYTGGKLPGDGFSFVHPFDGLVPPAEIVTEIAGFRHYKDGLNTAIRDLANKQVKFRREADNKFDPNAVAVELVTSNEHVGYVNRGLACNFSKWARNYQVNGTIERINGNPSRPSVLLNIQIS